VPAYVPAFASTHGGMARLSGREWLVTYRNSHPILGPVFITFVDWTQCVKLPPLLQDVTKIPSSYGYNDMLRGSFKKFVD